MEFMNTTETLEIPIRGMDCADCTRHVQKAIAALPGVDHVDVFLASEKALVRLDPQLVDLPAIRAAVTGAGYTVGEPEAAAPAAPGLNEFSRQLRLLLVILFGTILFMVIVGEGLGLFDAITARLPWFVGLLIVLLAGLPVFKNVARAARKGQVIAHTLMTVGVLAALVVGEWVTALVVVIFMRVGDYVEHFTAERARRAVRDLTALAPQTARLLRDGEEIEVPAAQVQPGETVILRPGDKVPVDGEVLAGSATIDQAAITGESMPIEAGPGSHIFAASLVRLGSLQVRATEIGKDTTFGHVIRLVEEAEAQRADVQRLADKFSAYYLPVVAGIAALTFIIRRDPMATAAVLVVACSCAFALATPIAILASVGAGARRGLMFKGGKYIELLDKAGVLLIDKTGTLTLGKPQIVETHCLVDKFPGIPASGAELQSSLLALVASAERYSEHPLAQAVRTAALQAGLELQEPQEFQARPGLGVSALVNGRRVAAGSRRMLELGVLQPELDALADKLEQRGRTLLYAAVDGQPVLLLAAADTLRPEVPQALQQIAALGMRTIELLTGDNERTAASVAAQIEAALEQDGASPLQLRWRANLLPEDKIRIVKEYQAQGQVVVMVGDGVNDAPALAQADVGIAMGAAGSDIAIEAAHIALMREDWLLIPQALQIARRTMRVVKGNIAFTAAYNLIGLSLAALGFLSPIFAAAAQSIPDLVILGNSSRLLRQK
jgi:Cd2+/Zn2+-exporting ATPase/Cu+-exporting ATPase